MIEAKIVDAKYVFLDIVGFTRDRDVEAQAECVEKLNTVVTIALDSVVKVAQDDRILLPTGDGMCIVLLGRDAPYDLHMQVALTILANLDANNRGTEEEMLRFEVRIGINENADNLITDINGTLNMAGSGINVAQRVMDSADGNQILVSTRVHETLRERRGYRGWFREYPATTKHDQTVYVYQFVKKGVTGLNLDEPQSLREPEPVKKEEPRLSKHVAYYLAHAIRNHSVLLDEKRNVFNDYAYVVLLHLLAGDAARKSETTELERFYPHVHKATSTTFWEQYEYYDGLDDDVIREFSHFIEFGNKERLNRFGNCFFQDKWGISDFRAASDYGKRKLKEEWSTIWEEFDLDNPNDSEKP